MRKVILIFLTSPSLKPLGLIATPTTCLPSNARLGLFVNLEVRRSNKDRAFISGGILTTQVVKIEPSLTPISEISLGFLAKEPPMAEQRLFLKLVDFVRKSFFKLVGFGKLLSCRTRETLMFWDEMQVDPS